MNESDVQELIAEIRSQPEGKNISNQQIYDFMHANNLGADADKNKHLFGDIKFRADSQNPADKENTFVTIAKDLIQAAKDHPEYSIPAAALTGYGIARTAPKVKEGVSSLMGRLLSNAGKESLPVPQDLPSNSTVVSVADKPVDYTIPAVTRKQASVVSPTPVAQTPQAAPAPAGTPTLSDLQNRAALGAGQPVAPTPSLTPSQERGASIVNMTDQEFNDRYRKAPNFATPVQAAAPAPVQAPVATAPAQPPVAQAPQTVAAAEPSVAPETPVVKKGRPAGAKNLSSEERQLKEAAKGINMYRNMFGFDAKNPESPKSLAAIQATDRLIAEGFGGAIPASRDPFLNPSTDIGASGKKFYSGTPEGHRNVYIPWLEKNLNTLPAETQSHILEAMTKGQTKDLTKVMKGLGIAVTGLAAYQTAFAKNPQERALAGTNLMGAILPPGADILEAGAPGVNMTPDVYKLGSPYYSSQEAKNYRQAQLIGGGRGIAPPSAYMR